MEQAPREYRLAELAELIGGEVRGDRSLSIRGLASLEHAASDQLSFVNARRFLPAARTSSAAALLVPPPLADEVGDRPRLIHDHVDRSLVELLHLFHPAPAVRAGVHASAVLEPGSAVDPTAQIGPHVTIGAHSTVGPRVVLHASVTVGRRCVIGADSVLYPQVVLYDSSQLGERVVLHSGVVIGADGFRYLPVAGGPLKVPQVGRVVIEDDVEIGANSAVDRGGIDETRIGARTKIDNLVQIGHNVRIGSGALLCGQAGIAGSARLGDGVVLGGKAGVLDHVEMEDGARAAGQAFVADRVPAGTTVAGSVAMPVAQWRRQLVLLRRLEDTRRRVLRMEKALAELETMQEEGDRG